MSASRPIRALLVEPAQDRVMDNRPGTAMPLGAGYVAAWARGRGWDCEFEDLNRLDAGPAWFSRRIRNRRPDVIGLSCSPWNRGAWAGLFAAARQAAPDALLVAGGLSVRHGAAAFLARFPALDAAVQGEGELPFEELLRRMHGVRRPRRAIARLAGAAGVAFRTGRRIVPAAARPLLERIDECPSPIVSGLFRPGDYPGIAKLLTARGCPFRCAYCQWGSTRTPYRAHGVDYVIAELRVLHEAGVRDVAFGDGTFNFDTRRLRALRDAFRREGFAFRVFDVDCRARLFNDTQAALLAGLGAVDVGFGLETIHAKTQARIRKRQDPRDVARAVRCARRHGLHVHVSVMIGLPGESESEIGKTLDFLERLAPDFAGIFPVRVQAGTELAARPDRYGDALPPGRALELAEQARRRFRTVGPDPLLYERRQILADAVFPHAGRRAVALGSYGGAAV